MDNIWAEYQEAMNRLAVSLLAVSNHLANVSTHCKTVSRECHNVAENIKAYEECIKDDCRMDRTYLC